MGIGVIIRDDTGLVVAAMSKKVKAPLGPVEIEAKAFEVGLQFAKDVGLQEFILEGDSLNVYLALVGLSPLLVLVADGKIHICITYKTYAAEKLMNLLHSQLITCTI